jgi:hypothetical protein
MVTANQHPGPHPEMRGNRKGYRALQRPRQQERFEWYQVFEQVTPIGGLPALMFEAGIWLLRTIPSVGDVGRSSSH